MEKVLIIGCPGAGKSTFGRKLAAKTGLPLFYLDMIWHKPDRTTVSFDEFDERLEQILESNQWIIDGNYKRTLSWRLMYADTVFYFDLPVELCLQGAIDRLGEERPDMPWHDSELSEDFRQWILDYPAIQLPVIEFLLKHFSGKVYRFTDREQADAFIQSL
ncbi:MAG: hypothetical protein K2M10_06005 [Muribaculaceae bacterium]|nr:hypothetical protein [Muribaculaceae bacterium]MDE6299180.1 hypothetical protein [Muribaculaceae bacterium]